MGWKISDKPTVDPKDADLALIEQDGNTRNTTWAKLKAFFLGTATLATTDQTIKGAINEVKASTDANTTSLSDKAKQVDLNNHLADLITDSNGAHGLKVESGVWTPVLFGGTTAGINIYGFREGYYYKVGKQVKASFRISISAKDTNMAGAIYVGGLPFATENTVESGSIGYFDNFNIGANYIPHIFTLPISNNIALTKSIVTGSGTLNIVASEIVNTFAIAGTITYQTA